MFKHLKRFFSLYNTENKSTCNYVQYVNPIQPIFTIQPIIDQNILILDKNKTTQQLVQEISDYIDNMDFPLTTIGINEQDVIEFRTFSEMFDTINGPLYVMLEKYNINEVPNEILASSYSDGIGWNFASSLLPYFKQLLIKALHVRDLMAPGDR